jgi:hypothetical protein
MKKFTCFILAAAFALTLFGCGNKPQNNTPDTPPEPPPEEIIMPDGEQEKYTFTTLYDAAEEKEVSAEAAVFEINKSTDGGRYLKLEVENTVSLFGTFTYSNTETSKEMTEPFYIPAGEAGKKTEFRQFLDAFRSVANKTSKTGDDESKAKIGQARKASWLKSVSFVTRGGHTGTVKLHTVESSKRSIDATKPLYLQNEYYKIGTDFAYGGSLTYLEKLPRDGKTLELTSYKDGSGPYIGLNASKKEGMNTDDVDKAVNLIDINDTGRLVQQSYYGSDVGYEGVRYNNKQWCYNPVQGGDQYNNVSQIIDYRLFEDEIYVKTRAMDWGRDGFTTYSYMENRYSFEGDDIKVYNAFEDWSGQHSHNGRTQEMPAVYLHYAFTNFVTYRGNEPWTGGELVNVDDLPYWGGDRDIHDDIEYYDGNENWSAWVNAEGYGVGVYVPGLNNYVNGTYGSRTDLSTSPSNYTSPHVFRSFFSYRRDEYSYLLTVGEVDEMRAKFKEAHDTDRIVNVFAK